MCFKSVSRVVEKSFNMGFQECCKEVSIKICRVFKSVSEVFQGNFMIPFRLFKGCSVLTICFKRLQGVQREF